MSQVYNVHKQTETIPTNIFIHPEKIDFCPQLTPLKYIHFCYSAQENVTKKQRKNTFPLKENCLTFMDVMWEDVEWMCIKEIPQ